MTNLILDFGNTRSKVYVFTEGELTSKKVFLHEEEAQVNAHIASLKFDKAILSATSDKPDYLATLIPDLMVLSHHLSFPFQIDYSTPKTLGSDRIALAAGAQLLYPEKNTLVIDAGTCITFDFVNDNGNYMGGAISPGLTMRLQSLNTFTDKLPFIEANESFNFQLIGKSTKESIQSGVLLGTIAELNGIIEQYDAIYEDLTVILSGGDLDFFALHLKKKIFAHSNLQAMGLNYILDYNA